MFQFSLAMRKAHGGNGTLFEGFGYNFKFRGVEKKLIALLKFCHTQYAPFCAVNSLKNNEFLYHQKIIGSAELLQDFVYARLYLLNAALQTTLQGEQHGFK